MVTATLISLLVGNLRQSLLLRERAEKTLRESEERYRNILQAAMDGFWRVDLQGGLLEVNETYCRMSGYSAKELLAMRIPDLEASETASDTAVHIQRVVAQGEDRFETRQRRKDGTTLDVEVSAQYRPVDGRSFVVFLRDITQRKAAAEALRNSEKGFGKPRGWGARDTWIGIVAQTKSSGPMKPPGYMVSSRGPAPQGLSQRECWCIPTICSLSKDAWLWLCAEARTTMLNIALCGPMARSFMSTHAGRLPATLMEGQCACWGRSLIFPSVSGRRNCWRRLTAEQPPY